MAAALSLLAGCGGADESTGGPPGGVPGPGDGGVLRWASAGLPSSFDPLEAGDPGSVVVCRQIYEPLIARVRPAYGSGPGRPGLIVSASATADRTIWRFRLRGGVRFADGTPFNAAAVLANARRWLADPDGSRLLGPVTGVDAPDPREVRFIASRPVPDLPKRLGSARLGIVSPEAFDQDAAGVYSFSDGAEGAGTGPFTAAGIDSRIVELGWNRKWWGVKRGLGPALSAIVFRRDPSAAGRLRSLRLGEVQVAELPPGSKPLGDPLLSRIGSRLVAERSVRGLIDDPAPQLSAVWLTTVAP